MSLLTVSNAFLEFAMAGVAMLIILHDILSTTVALLLDNPLSNWYTLLTVVGWNAANSDAAFLTYVSKLQLDVWIWLARSGPIFADSY